MHVCPRGGQKSLSISCGGAWTTFLGYSVSSPSWTIRKVERYVSEPYGNRHFLTSTTSPSTFIGH